MADVFMSQMPITSANYGMAKRHAVPYSQYTQILTGSLKHHNARSYVTAY